MSVVLPLGSLLASVVWFVRTGWKDGRMGFVGLLCGGIDVVRYSSRDALLKEDGCMDVCVNGR
jgi:hypothetical protein